MVFRGRFEIKLDAKVPAGPLQQKWEKHQFEMKLVNPANKRKYHVLVVGTSDLQGTGTVDKATGKTLTLESTGTMKSRIELPDQGVITADSVGWHDPLGGHGDAGLRNIVRCRAHGAHGQRRRADLQRGACECAYGRRGGRLIAGWRGDGLST